MTLGKSLHHFSMPLLSWAFYLTSPVDLWIHESLLSVTFKAIYTFSSQEEHMYLDGRCKESGKFPALCLPEITTAATGVSLPLWEVEDKKPQGQWLPGESQLHLRGKKPWSHPRWNSSTQDYVLWGPKFHTGRQAKQEWAAEKERKPYSCLLEAGAEKGFIFQTAMWRT